MGESSTGQPFRLFVSYAHDDEPIKTRLVKHLDPLEGEGYVELWEDGAIPLGAKWREEIGAAMDWADGALFLVSADFLASDFCKSVEVPHFLKRYQEDQNVALIFVLVDDCLWKVKPYIEERQILPCKAKPIKAHGRRDKAYTAIAEAIHQYVVTATRRPKGHVASKDKTPPAALTLPALLAKLPGATAHLFGREAELKQLDEWRNHKGALLWVADGGAGKSALLRKWLETQDWPSETRFIGHSFYSQGSNNQATSARGFLLDALKQLGVVHETNASDDELGRLLAREAAGQSTVLALDGIEPLQQASTDEKLNGTLKDSGLAVLLEALAKRPGQALCLASSRLPVPECGITDGPYFRQRPLNLLAPAGARQLLENRGVTGTADELAKLSERCGHHPLALALAAEFCHTYLQDSAAEFLKRDWQPQPKGHAATVMGWFDAALADEHQVLDREMARILGLFDRPAPWGALMALKEVDPIPGLSVALHEASESALLESLARLSQWGLLDADLTRQQPDLDAHPLVREHFGELLAEQDRAAWRAAHNVLFDWFCGVPEKECPDTLEELEPLYRAVGHGCKAGRFWTALDMVYRNRIQRGEQGYSLFRLGAYSADLSALTGFFLQGWNLAPIAQENCPSEEKLNEDAQTWILGEAAFCLASLGYLTEALRLRCFEWRVWQESKEDEENFCCSSENLMDLLIPMGRWAEAETLSHYAESTAVLIENKEDRWRHTMSALAYRGHILHGQGRLDCALTVYALAEKIQAGAWRDPKLFGIYGYFFNQLLMERESSQILLFDILSRAKASQVILKKQKRAHTQALDHCAIGSVLAALGDPAAGDEFDLAVTTMQRSSLILDLPPMHLARANFLRHLPNLPAAWADHDAAHAIAQRGNMRTNLAECALLAGNLCLDDARVPEAAAQYATAAQLIRKDGYGRRLAELHLLHARLLHAQHDPAATLALAEAETRIRETGQWFFWRELHAVAQEIGAADPGECPASDTP
jgi:hypothetical protein